MIKLVRLITGEDIICQIEKTPTTVKLKKPHRLILTKEGLASMPLCPFSKDEVYDLDPKNILFEVEPESDIHDSYASQTGVIVIPNSSIVKP
jgi:hypothetical protein